MGGRPSMGGRGMTQTEPNAQQRPNTRPFARSFAAALAFSVAGFIIVLATVGPPASSRGAGYAFGTFLGPGIIAALIAAFAAWRSPKLWSPWKYLVIVSLIGFVFLILFVASTMAEQVA